MTAELTAGQSARASADTEIPIGDRFVVHGVRISVASDHARAAAALRRRLRHFHASGAESTGDARETDIHVEIRAVDEGRDHPIDRPSVAMRRVYDPPAGEVLYARATDELYIDYLGRVRVLCDAATGRIQISIRELSGTDWWLGAHPLFTLPLVEMMKRNGRYMVHAAGVCRDGRALLLPGESGAGKSTLTLALMRAGFALLGDDTCYLSATPSGLRILPFADAMNVTDHTAQFFPEVSRAEQLPHEVPRRPGTFKRSVLPEDVFDIELASECAPAVVVFPAISDREESIIEPLDPASALLELTPNVLLTDPRSSQLHLDALAALVRESRCYRLKTGRDFDRIPALLGSLLE
ncbi:MAG: hypothetical protein M3081_13740 [Gemmatimonadota bacterium]|nr:hypothetical protein [Gemmatimonadota bacterium]